MVPELLGEDGAGCGGDRMQVGVEQTGGKDCAAVWEDQGDDVGQSSLRAAAEPEAKGERQ